MESTVLLTVLIAAVAGTVGVSFLNRKTDWVSKGREMGLEPKPAYEMRNRLRIVVPKALAAVAAAVVALVVALIGIGTGALLMSMFLGRL